MRPSWSMASSSSLAQGLRLGYLFSTLAEGNANQQKRLKFFDNTQIEKHAGNGDHHQALPAATPGKANAWATKPPARWTAAGRG